ncbi:peptidoglycan DD-metalloendopeptidase family protein [Microbacterium sp.]|uniref:peptidoglycan DD-metalloendopeptidase family protein n=1 Tax=unclassified Microbacterium TaxID=2609290 RepID=UPI002718E8F9|nr:M23 family metallopeptidase [Microbacterium sp.]MDO8384066.1 M23 family metallopeptidase [Microbacterium sp.]
MRIGALGLLAAASLGVAAPAFAATYPSWDDVQRARDNEAAKATEISRIQGFIATLNANVIRTQAAAEEASQEFFVAEEEYFAAVARADEFQSQADTQAAVAATASERAGRVAAEMYRSGGDDTSLRLFFSDAGDADQLLSRLGRADKLLQRNRDAFADASLARGAAQSLSDQAAVARDERDRLKQLASQRMEESQAAADAAQQALDEQSTNLVVLEAQLAALQDSTARTVADYQAGVEARRRAEQEARRRAEEEARRAAEAAAAPGGGGGGQIGQSGWARPSGGRPTSRYGARATICENGYCTGYHYGTDMATGCGAGVFAASAGRVAYAGTYGAFGQHVRIDHGGGILTAYSHLQQGGILVGYGQQVAAGQLVAREGNSGLSRGCHLHFEVWRNGQRINPEPFMSERGISI